MEGPLQDNLNLTPEEAREVPASLLLVFAFAAGGAAAALGWMILSPGAGLILGFVTWVALAQIGTARLYGKVSRRSKELLEAGRTDDALWFLRACAKKYPRDRTIRGMVEALEAVTAVPGPGADAAVDAEVVPGASAPGENTAHPDGPAHVHADAPAVPVPAEPVASDLAIFVWVLAMLAFFPVLGAVAGLALLGVSIFLLWRRGQLPWDRNMAIMGIAIGSVSFAIWAVALASVLTPGKSAGDPLSVGTMAFTWQIKAVQFAVLAVSIILHEVAHAASSCWCGDTTARDKGRISLWPHRHVDLFGSIIVPGILLILPGGCVIGWAKPVPVAFERLRNKRRGTLAVSLSGVSVNLFLALFSAALLMGLGGAVHLMWREASAEGLAIPWQTTVFSGVPWPRAFALAAEALKAGIFVNIIPVPPLDGFKALTSILPQSLALKMEKLNAAGMLILLALLALNLLDYLLIPGALIAVLLSMFAAAVTRLG
jgi:Zn-dependent protease